MMSDIKWTEDKTWEQVQEEMREHYAQQSKEFEMKWQEEQKRRDEKEARERLALIERLNKEAEKQNPVIGSAIRKYEQEARTKGEITNTFIKQNLDGKITVARWTLALAMGMTLLFKGFWALWILFILLYNWEVKRLKKEALEADMKRGKKK